MTAVAAIPVATAPESVWMARPKLRGFVIALTKPAFLSAGAVIWLVIRLVEPWRRVRVGMLVYDRIGHLAINTEIFLRRTASHPDPRDYTILVSGPPANRQLFEMIARRTRVWRSPWALRLFVHGLRPFIAGTRFELELPFNGNEYEILAGAKPQLSFTAEEEETGRRVLLAMGLEPGTPYVCFHARDRAYLDAIHPQNTLANSSYHDYRDCAIENYLPAIRGLAERGLFALRMGAVAERPLSPDHPRIIDYAAKHRSDFADVYLLARCKFMLASTSGICVVPPIFGVPVALANFTPLGYSTWSAHDLFIPKTYQDASGRVLSYRRIMELGASMWIDGQQFQDAGIRVVENTADEIAELAEEMDARLEGRWVAQPEDDELQRKYRDLFPPEHRITGYPARVGAAFLRRHRALLD